MSTEEQKKHYRDHGFRDARKKRYPLYAVLTIAQEHVAAASYLIGWREGGGANLRFFREGEKR
jgi:hypothetical protein